MRHIICGMNVSTSSTCVNGSITRRRTQHRIYDMNVQTSLTKCQWIYHKMSHPATLYMWCVFSLDCAIEIYHQSIELRYEYVDQSGCTSLVLVPYIARSNAMLAKIDILEGRATEGDSAPHSSKYSSSKPLRNYRTGYICRSGGRKCDLTVQQQNQLPAAMPI